MKKITKNYVILPHDRTLINDAFLHNRSVMIRSTRMFTIDTDDSERPISEYLPSGATLDDDYSNATVPIVQFVAAYDEFVDNMTALKYYPTEAVRLGDSKNIVMTEYAIVKKVDNYKELFSVATYGKWYTI